MGADLQFDEATHTYWLRGKRLPSVTQVLDQLEDWSRVDPIVLEEAKRRGQHVHRMVQLDVGGVLDEDALDPFYRPYLAQWRKFLAETRFRPVLSEQQIYHEALGYAGTFDLMGMLGTDFYQVDVKSGLIPRTVGLQTAAYHTAGVLLKSIPPNAKRAALQLHDDRYRFHPITAPVAFDMADFTAALRLHQWRERNA